MIAVLLDGSGSVPGCSGGSHPANTSTAQHLSSASSVSLLLTVFCRFCSLILTRIDSQGLQSHLPLVFQCYQRAVRGRRCSEMKALLLANYCNRSLATGRGRNELCMLKDKKDRMERGFSYSREWERNVIPGMREGCAVSPDTTQNPHTPPHPHQPPPNPPLLHSTHTTALQPQDELVVNNKPSDNALVIWFTLT